MIPIENKGEPIIIRLIAEWNAPCLARGKNLLEPASEHFNVLAFIQSIENDFVPWMAFSLGFREHFGFQVRWEVAGVVDFDLGGGDINFVLGCTSIVRMGKGVDDDFAQSI